MRGMDQMFLVKNFLLILIILIVPVVEGIKGEYDVLTKYGIVRGKLTRSARGRFVANFLGIPYAEPPVGKLRFSNPRAWTYKWDGWFDARKDRSKCIQQDKDGNVLGSEDCLYLNCFTPYETVVSGNAEKLPVIVFVHGGAFNSGSSNSSLYAPDYFLDQDIVLVTLNYRMNSLGFFSTASNASPGNYGLKDIVMALRWVQENIGAFGGDANEVTLMGQSAGAAAVHILTLTNKTEGLFNKHILHSGSSLAPWAVHPRRNIRNASLRLAKILGCLPERIDNVEQMSREPREISDEAVEESQEDSYTEEDEKKMMECMRTIAVKRIGKMSSYYQVWKQNPWCVFGPTIEDESEDAVLTMPPMTIIRNRLFRDMPRILGVVRDEGLVKSIKFITEPKTREEFIENYELYLPYLIEHHEIVANTTVLANNVERLYFDGNVTENLMNGITEVIGDATVTSPTYLAAKYQSPLMHSNSYFFWFCYEGTFSTTFATGTPERYGVSHTDDLNYLFPILNNLYGEQFQLHNTENDTTVINIMTEMWSHFATHGVPKAWRVPTWPVFDRKEEFLMLGNGRSWDVTVGRNLYPVRMAFWEFLREYLTVETADDELLLGNIPSEVESDGSERREVSFLLSLLIVVSLCV